MTVHLPSPGAMSSTGPADRPQWVPQGMPHDVPEDLQKRLRRLLGHQARRLAGVVARLVQLVRLVRRLRRVVPLPGVQRGREDGQARSGAQR